MARTVEIAVPEAHRKLAGGANHLVYESLTRPPRQGRRTKPGAQQNLSSAPAGATLLLLCANPVVYTTG